MKRIIALLITIVCILNMSVVVFSEDETSETATYATGSLEMSPEEVAQLKANIPMITGVKPNQLYIDRLNEEPEISLMSNGLNYEIAEDGEEIITNTDDSIHLMGTDNIPLPSKVDNSTENTFPIIKKQGNIGSCLGWSLGYYQLTNNANKIRGTKAKNGSANITSNVYSPNWIYNLSNNGSDIGTYGNAAVNVLYTFGCPSIARVPISTSDFLDWYAKEVVWEDALENKCDLYYGTVNPDSLNTPITSPNSSYLNDIKKILANGYVVTIETYVGSNNSEFPVVKSGRTSNNTSTSVWIEIQDNDDTTGHAVTIVGYDDNFRVDINDNGIYEDGEYGAFKIANSWGTNADYHTNGYIWLAYDALNAKSSVLDSNDLDRNEAFRYNGLYYFVKPQKNYRPLLTANVEITTQHRNALSFVIGIVDSENTEHFYEKDLTEIEYISGENSWCYDIEDIAFRGGGGSYNLKGNNKESNETGEVVFDITSLLNNFELKENHTYTIYIKCTNNSSNRARIESISLWDNNISDSTKFTNTPKTVKNNTVQFDVTYLSSIKSVEKDKTFLLTFNSNVYLDNIAEYISITNSDDEMQNISINNATEKNKLYIENNNIYQSDYYTLNISKNLKSIGKNSLETDIETLFYVPFH